MAQRPFDNFDAPLPRLDAADLRRRLLRLEAHAAPRWMVEACRRQLAEAEAADAAAHALQRQEVAAQLRAAAIARHSFELERIASLQERVEQRRASKGDHKELAILKASVAHLFEPPLPLELPVPQSETETAAPAHAPDPEEAARPRTTDVTSTAADSLASPRSSPRRPPRVNTTPLREPTTRRISRMGPEWHKKHGL